MYYAYWSDWLRKSNTFVYINSEHVLCNLFVCIRVKILLYKTDDIMHILSSLRVYVRLHVCLLNIFNMINSNYSPKILVAIWVSLDLIFSDFLCDWRYSKTLSFYWVHFIVFWLCLIPVLYIYCRPFPSAWIF